jgi:hydrogenase maturation protein HypF
LIERIHITIRGAVQGVGFRPFVFRLAQELNLFGSVRNSPQGVFIEAEGTRRNLETFLLKISKEKPPRSFIQSLESSYLDPLGFKDFQIVESKVEGERTALILPDIAVCSDCLTEIFDPANRRYLYPFANCTNCGPRFSIIQSLPYDRPNTTMKKFEMCENCRKEYEDPRDRRFHAQPNACPMCGPHVELWNTSGDFLSRNHTAMLSVAEMIRSGKILAIKGLGGFHLVVDARNEKALARLRERKYREEKPFALMYPSLDMVKSSCEVSELEERLLLSPESPIVLLKIRRAGFSDETDGSQFEPSEWSPHEETPVESSDRLKTISTRWLVAPSVAPNNPYLGIMLPYTPLHHILLRELRFPVVATSGNLSNEPICTDEKEALARLKHIADGYLVHNRPIARHVDDSIVRMMGGRELVLRRARGYAPLPVQVAQGGDSPILAVGAHLKNTIAMMSGTNIFLSQHIGDLETNDAYEAFKKVITSFENLYGVRPTQIVCDMHPDYLSAKYARELGADVTEVQHHYAHIASCMAENELDGRVLGVSWDGTGFGLDGTVWGGEFLLIDETSFRRVATFRKFRLPGGSRSIREPRRTALGLLFEAYGSEVVNQSDVPSFRSFSTAELTIIREMVARGINSPFTTSVGRLFDAVASITGLRQYVDFEGQAAMELEFSIGDQRTDDNYGFRILEPRLDPNKYSKGQRESGILSAHPWIVVDWEPLVTGILEDITKNVAVGFVSAKFHNTLTDIIVDLAQKIGEKRIVLSGGCFQNRYLTERTVCRLEEQGFRAYWHQRVPPNDGGIALGQVYALVRAMRGTRATTFAQMSDVMT